MAYVPCYCGEPADCLVTDAIGVRLLCRKCADAAQFAPEPLKPSRCDCGALKVKTTHSHWCSTVKA